jgi:hypothetical protein
MLSMAKVAVGVPAIKELTEDAEVPEWAETIEEYRVVEYIKCKTCQN